MPLSFYFLVNKECHYRFAVINFCNKISFDTLTEEDLNLVAGFIGSNLQVTTSKFPIEYTFI